MSNFSSFLGSGWSFPPSFADGQVTMSHNEQDIHESLRILFGTVTGERFLQPEYGLSVNHLLFEPTSTTLRTFTVDRIRLALLKFEPRIKILQLDIRSEANEGRLSIVLEYEVRATNSRFNLVYPFYNIDSNEARSMIAGGKTNV